MGALDALFEGLKVSSIDLIRDPKTDKPKGFGYVEFVDAETLKSALKVDGEIVQGRELRVELTGANKRKDGKGSDKGVGKGKGKGKGKGEAAPPLHCETSDRKASGKGK